jgi:hypothetical protein
MTREVQTELAAEDLVPRLMGCGTDKAAMLEALTGVSVRVFQIIDEKPALFDPNYHRSDWFPTLRQIRNDPANDLFDRLIPLQPEEPHVYD